MPKFKVKVTLTAHSTYEVEVEGDTEELAELAAANLWREKSSSDFQADKVDRFDFETEQLTWECDEYGCGAVLTEEQYRANDGRCDPCKAEYDREDADAG